MDTAHYSFFFVLALLLISCDSSGPDTTFYDVSVSVVPEGTGTISPTADSSYEADSTVTLQAIANEGYYFTGWTGDIDTTVNPLSLTVGKSYSLTAKFIDETEDQFYLHENGVTILCPDAEPGQKGMVNGTEYMAVDRTRLDQKIDNGEDLSTVCTSPVKEMVVLFRGNEDFNQDISSWDVSSVTNMSSMFSRAESFNQDLNSWNVSNVTDMSSMFSCGCDAIISGSSSFNGDISSWDVSNVTDMSSMFRGAEDFDQDLNNWNVSKVTDMSSMFAGGYDGNAYEITPTNFNGDISAWNVGSVTDMGSMFKGAENFNQDLNNWNVSNVTDMGGMFSGATSFNGNIGEWNVSNVTNMNFMFENAEIFNQDISGWCVSNISEEPEGFSDGSALSEEHHPVWGTCPQ